MVFTDVVMPGLSGTELAQRVRERFPGLPVLLATGYSDDMLKSGAQQFQLVRKPYGQEDLAKALSQALEAVRRPGAPGEA